MNDKKHYKIEPLNDEQEEKVIICGCGCFENFYPYPAIVKCTKCVKVFKGRNKKHWPTVSGIIKRPVSAISKCPDCGEEAKFNTE